MVKNCFNFPRQYSLSSGASTTSNFEVQSDNGKLKEFYQHLSYVLDRNISSDEMLREIRTAIGELQHHKVCYPGSKTNKQTNNDKHRIVEKGWVDIF